MKNQFKPLAALLTKSKQLFIQRKDDAYYITDGFIGVKIARYYYDTFYTSVNLMFRPLADGEKIGYENGLPSARVCDVVSLINNIKADTPLTLSKFCYRRAGRVPALVFGVCGGKLCAFDDRFIAAINPDLFSDIRQASLISPAVFGGDDDYTVICCPVRIQEEVLEEAKKIMQYMEV